MASSSPDPSLDPSPVHEPASARGAAISAAFPSVSVIIPAVNEGVTIGAAIASAWSAGAEEVIVVDGGSQDETIREARQQGAAVVTTGRGRALQQNAGAAQARGEVLLFLHADSRLTPSCLSQIRAALAVHAGPVLGAFHQTVDAPGWRYRLLERGNGWRVRLLGLAYGDQGLFVRRSWFDRVGGFPEVPLLEDLMLSRRARSVGPLLLLPGPLITSARRWQRHGVVQQTLRNWSIVARYFLGADPATLRSSYQSHDHGSGHQEP